MCNIIHILVLSFFGLVLVSDGQIIQNGQCNTNIELQANFDISQFEGTWYEYSVTDHPLAGDCSSFEFSQTGDSTTVSHRNVQNNFLNEYFGTASAPLGSAQMTLNMPQISNTPINFWVWMTDYNNFALIYNCENVGNTQRRIYIWQLTKQQTPTEMTIALMDTAIANNLGITANELRRISRTTEACYVLPNIQPGEPIVLPGQCDPNIPVVQNFNVANFLGVWHQMASYYSENSEGSCNRAQYTTQDGLVVDVVNSEINDQKLRNIAGTARVVSTDGSAKLNVVLEVVPNVFAESELLILGTDYNQWAVSYTCMNLPNNQKRVFSWIASRTRTLPAAAQAQVDAVIDSFLDLNKGYYQTTDQSNNACFYVPEYVPGQPAVFGGQCDQTISVQPNFVAANYLELWHVIELFPNQFQSGTCSNAFYSLREEGVNVFNSHVVNERLNTITGLGVPVGNEAKLRVTFPNSNEPSDYWIISTDYTSYSLVYSCANINDYEQRITMWKLSRTKSLTQTAIEAIDRALATQTVFDPRFFVRMDQSPEACFYYPEPNGERVVFPGQCSDENIGVVQNINLNSFANRWYEVEAYPKEFQPGVCVEHTFTVANNGFNLVSTSVADQLLTVANSQVTSTGTDGRFTITIATTEGPRTIPYEIIATDYTSYALAYSCVNINNDFKAIYSWKLSRSKQLSADAATAVNTAMATIRVLSQEYFEPMDQSDDGCFYFPDLAPGAPVILPGQCDSEDKLPIKRNFDAAAYLNSWRLIESYPSGFQEGQCNRARYSLNADGSVQVYNTEVLEQTLKEAIGRGELVTDANNQPIGKLLVTFPESPIPFELYILDTDYENYSLVYGCMNLENNRRQVQSWKMSRTKTLSPASVAAIEAVMSTVTVLNNRYYQTIDHSDAACFYYPESDGNSTIIFPGQCDETISVVTNFDAEAYMRLWHDIERYPQPFQQGTCGNAFYTLRDGPIVDVYNTQVVDQKLDVIRGTAVLDRVNEQDTSAKLLVTFPPPAGPGFPSPYWVLRTDYQTYALVYSCVNINEEYRSVSSWKLSRTKSLTPAAVTAINEIVNNIDVLDDRYFIKQDQTPEGCFYFPEPQPGVPVVFPGQCDANLRVVQNFNFDRFAGLWHEIEAYPKAEQGGQCINHVFRRDGSELRFESSNVIAQTLGVTSGTVRVTSTDNSAKLELQFVSEGRSITIPYWIVDTDYENYALAYSCVNDGSDYRKVWSWKLSKNKQLSPTSVAAINTAIADIDVLNNMYYEPISQTPESCFYYPDLGPDDPVILPGQCDTTISGVQNFDASRYLGTWRTIETYASEFQLGTCGEATYSLNPNGTVDVFNTEVIDQTLSTINGVAEVASTDGTGQLLVYFPDVPVPSNYYILATDYDNYALVYSCYNVNSEQRRVHSWKLSRTNTLSENAVTEISRVVASIDVLSERYYQPVDRSYSGCFYYPETDGSSSVIFRGQCDESISVVTDFDAEAYMRLWYDIERYPQPFQQGTCGNAFYTLRDGPIVDVYNTQVVDQKLDVIRGTAVLDRVNEQDTSAKLLVTFPPPAGPGFPSPYWVLRTDYQTYALVYSCVNINEYYRSVSSWKLSRTKSLTPAAVTAINEIVNNIDVLDDRYFIKQDQTPEGCFYFPEPQPGVPVVFPGQCDANLGVVQNFNFDRFAGLWHEIEAYPKAEQGGQCINHVFRRDGSELRFESSNVIAQTLGVTSGTVRVTSTDNSAKLELQFVSEGRSITIPYWIVDTDYENYALAYSCVNDGSDYRKVWSWKLSKNKQLSPTSVAAINTAIADIDVLNNMYYEPISQTPESCFYYPDLGPDDPVILPGQCDTTISGVQNFDASRYLGTWRTIETYASEFQLGTCGEATYSLNPNGTVDVFNTEVIDQTLSTINGVAEVASTDGTGQLLVYFPDVPVPSNYYILATDYDNYALVYSCYNVNSEQRRVHSWKLSRTNTLSENAVTEISRVVASIDVLSERYYQPVDRSYSGCFYYPETDGSSSVIFRGQCDESISVVTDFDAEAYMRLWYDIERYPQPFQQGTCGNAFYTLRDGPIVDVYNTQVVDQKLDVIRGTAVLDRVNEQDTSAKLLVTFPPPAGPGFPSPYWVLRTDYQTYALVYSCVNINEYYRSVSSWKLSRTKSLTPAAVTAINEIVNNIDVLDDRYFIKQDQTPEGCFYFPEPQPGVPVVFPGQCDANLRVVQNFNFDRFAGLWHEIEAYPKAEQGGQCINHVFRRDGSELRFESSNVIAQTLGVTSGTVRVTSTDNSAKLELQFVSDGRSITIPYWIVDTDYENYALAYSCVNDGSDYRKVWSWKLSKNKQLSPTSVAAINTAIADIDVLNNMYYEPISQTPESCFYYPDLGPDDPVILPGQCDTTISGVPNFDASRYLGTWRMIETYPSEFQLGTCSDATYTLNPNGTVDVFNTEVIDQTLSTINGVAEVASTDGTGQLLVYFPDAPVPSVYYILATDYDNYALVYSCANVDNESRRVYSWKLSRTNSLSPAAVTEINDAMSKLEVLDDRYYQTVSRTPESCFYFPEADGRPVLFRGECDENISVVTNFDAVRYSGTWYEVQAYPAPYQDGTCGTANYVLDANTGVVDVTNTQVINRDGSGPVLDVQEGFAVLATTDGTAKLDVTFNVSGVEVTTNYWVLATDYDSYALVYSCQKLNDEYRQVISWKLSRSKTLSNAANADIAAVIDRVQVLDQKYYVDDGQSEDDCFYYPENTGEDVVLPGQCVADEEIATLTDFDISRYVGWWHEMERYPVSADVGECTSSLYQTSTSGFLVTDTAVDNGQATVSDGTVQASANGRLRRTINGRTQDIWVLSTDYETYSLLYSCENVGDNQRRVWSAKHSKTKELSAAANSAMDRIIQSNQGLNSKYYMPVDQSDEGCFHYPEQTGQQVILPGQCDDNIPVVEQFDVEAYGGTWYQIERYPQIHEVASGTCVGARYTLQEDGTVTVLNWEVVDGELETIEGTATLIGNNNQAKLNVVLPVRNSTTEATVETSLYVLATDYESYSLAYSCSNVNSFQRSIGAWKLSRGRTLAAAGQTAINNVISARPELNQNYFVTVVHNENCLEPSSAALVKSSLFVILVCALWQILA